jgi:hypothetical protein
MFVFGFCWRVLCARRRRSAPAPSAPQRAHERVDPVLPERIEPLGPGCFDSSWDLLRGLDVSEGPNTG